MELMLSRDPLAGEEDTIVFILDLLLRNRQVREVLTRVSESLLKEKSLNESQRLLMVKIQAYGKVFPEKDFELIKNEVYAKRVEELLLKHH